MTAEARVEVLVAGDLFLDLVMTGFESWPNPGEESFAKEFHKEVGGGAAITACCLSKLEVRTFVLGVVGKSDGQWMLDELSKRGVDASGIQMAEDEPTAFTVSVSTSHDRALFTYGGANRKFPATLDSIADLAQRTGARHVHLGHPVNPTRAKSLFQAIHDMGCSVSLDVGWHPEWLSDPEAIRALRMVDVFFPNLREASEITKETEPRRVLQELSRLGLRCVALKMGGEGAALLCNGDVMFQEPARVVAVDTTGAGDCFDAGFLYAWLREMSPRLCLKAGAACGQASVRVMGGVNGTPTREELETLLCAAQ
jgi:sugar/nucleoside kinase (ribokinase family)